METIGSKAGKKAKLFILRTIIGGYKGKESKLYKACQETNLDPDSFTDVVMEAISNYDEEEAREAIYNIEPAIYAENK